jgi:hypothetical protein
MNVEIGAEAAQFPEKEYINGIAVAVLQSFFVGARSGPCLQNINPSNTEPIPLCYQRCSYRYTPMHPSYSHILLYSIVCWLISSTPFLNAFYWTYLYARFYLPPFRKKAGLVTSYIYMYCTVAGGKSGKTPGRNLPTRTEVNLRNSLVVINQSVSNLLRVQFFHTVLGNCVFFYKL